MSVLLVVSTALAGPFKLPIPSIPTLPAPPTPEAAAAMVGGAVCQQQVAAATQTCTLPMDPAYVTPEDLVALRRQVSGAHAIMTQACPSDPALATVAACLADFDGRIARADAEAAARRSAALPRVPELKADALYPSTVTRWAEAKAAEDRACAEAEALRIRHDPGYESAASRCVSANDAMHDADERLASLARQHGIDIRDGRALGAW